MRSLSASRSVRGPCRQPELLEQVRRRDAGRARHVQRAEDRAGARIDSENQRRRVRRMRDLDAGHHRGIEVTSLPQRILHGQRQLGRAADTQRAASLGNGASQPIFVRARGRGLPVEPDAGDRVDRAEIVPDAHAGADQGRVHAHVFEPPEAVKVHEALAHVGHRQRHPHARLDQIGQRRIGRVASFDDEPDTGDGFAQVVGDRRERRRGAGERERTAHDGCAEAVLHRVHATSTTLCTSQDSRENPESDLN